MSTLQKINVLLYGNCQISNIAKLLNYTYEDKLKIFHMRQVQLIKNLNYFQEVIPQIKLADVVILQNINGGKDPFKVIIPHIKKRTKVIFIDSLYNSSYHPELVQSKKIPTFHFGQLLDINILQAYLEKMPSEEFSKYDPFKNSSFYGKNKYESLYHQTIKNIKSRQKILLGKTSLFKNGINFEHIDIVPFISNNYKKNDQILWGDFNHPNLPVFEFIIEKLAYCLRLPFTDTIIKNTYLVENIRIINRPVYLSTIKFHNLTVHNSLYQLNKYTNIERDQYVKDIYAFYDMLDVKLLKAEYLNLSNVKLLESEKFYQKQINLFHKFEDLRDYSILLNRQGRYKEAMFYINKAIDIKKDRP